MTTVPMRNHLQDTVQGFRLDLAQSDDTKSLTALRERVTKVFDTFLGHWLSAHPSESDIPFSELESARKSLINKVDDRIISGLSVRVVQGQPVTNLTKAIPNLKDYIQSITARYCAERLNAITVPRLYSDRDFIDRVQADLQKLLPTVKDESLQPCFVELQCLCEVLSKKMAEQAKTVYNGQKETYFERQYIEIEKVFEAIDRSAVEGKGKVEMAWPYYKLLWCLCRIQRLHGALKNTHFSDLLSKVSGLYLSITAAESHSNFKIAENLGAWFKDTTDILKRDLAALKKTIHAHSIEDVEGRRLWYGLEYRMRQAIITFRAALEDHPSVKELLYAGQQTLSQQIDSFAQLVEDAALYMERKLPIAQPEKAKEAIPWARIADDSACDIDEATKKKKISRTHTWTWPNINPEEVMAVAGMALAAWVVHQLWSCRPAPTNRMLVQPDFRLHPRPFKVTA